MTAERRLPDFVIAGAMKSATTTVHMALANHPEVFIPLGEYHAYSVDDPEEHPPWHHSLAGEWITHDFDADPDYYLDRHAAAFTTAEPGMIVGVDAPAYLSAMRVPERLARHQPDVKLVFVLRDPAARTHSAYWHMVNVGIETRPFDEAVLHDPLLLKRSRYLPHLKRYFDLFPREQIHVIRFEDLVQDPKGQLHAVAGFLGLDADDVDVDAHANPGRYPRSPRVMRLRNRVMNRHWYAIPPPPAEQPVVGGPSRWFTVVHRAHRRLNPQEAGRQPLMDPDLHRWLDGHLGQANRGLNELVGWDIDSLWYRGPGST